MPTAQQYRDLTLALGLIEQAFGPEEHSQVSKQCHIGDAARGVA
jgi:hypothetical protein